MNEQNNIGTALKDAFGNVVGYFGNIFGSSGQLQVEAVERVSANTDIATQRQLSEIRMREQAAELMKIIVIIALLVILVLGLAKAYTMVSK